jgi:hypothetical protein
LNSQAIGTQGLTDWILNAQILSFGYPWAIPKCAVIEIIRVSRGFQFRDGITPRKSVSTGAKMQPPGIS